MPAEWLEQEKVLRQWEGEEDAAWARFSARHQAFENACERFAAGEQAAYEDMLRCAEKMGTDAQKTLAAREKARQAREVLVPTMRLEDQSGEQWTTL